MSTKEEGPDTAIGKVQQLLLEIEISLRQSKRKLACLRQQLSEQQAHTIPSDVQGTDAEQWLSLAEAACMAEVDRGTIMRHANTGAIADNGLRRRKRKVWKPSVLRWMAERLEHERKRGLADYSRTLDQIPEQH